MPVVVEAEMQHLFHGLVGVPMLKGDAICGDEHSGAIFTELAMNKNRWLGIFAKQREELCELFGGGIGKSAKGNRNETNSDGRGAGFFFIHRRSGFTAQIDDGRDAEIF